MKQLFEKASELSSSFRRSFVSNGKLKSEKDSLSEKAVKPRSAFPNYFLFPKQV
jgi:hypothetical protein